MLFDMVFSIAVHGLELHMRMLQKKMHSEDYHLMHFCQRCTTLLSSIFPHPCIVMNVFRRVASVSSYF